MWFDNLSNPEEAGWFQEAHPQPDKFGSLWAMTPKHKQQESVLVSSKLYNDIVLLSTGGFAPIHDGHIAMMETAKAHMESKGFRVVSGYISPGHDDYVVSHKGVSISAPERLAYANEKLKYHPWLMVDPWEAIGNFCSVNYTSVIDHLEKLLHRRVCYVVGSDNARFSLAFKDRGLCCVVQRSADVLPNPKYRNRSYSSHSKHVFIAENDPITGSSTEVRSDFVFGEAKKKKLTLRVCPASEKYIERLLSILNDYYFDVQLIHLVSQKLPEGILNLISLDQMIKSPFGNLEMSRDYIEGGYCKIGYTNRPSTPSLMEQIQAFAGMNVSLFDDDVYSGGTMRKATMLLKSVGCSIISYHALSFANGDESEIMDSRDLLPIQNGGLVVNGKRVPYIYPYVCPHVRASVLPEQAEEFSDRIRENFWN